MLDHGCLWVCYADIIEQSRITLDLLRVYCEVGDVYIMIIDFMMLIEGLSVRL